MSEVRMETKCVQSGYTPQNGEPRQIPIIQSTTFKYESEVLNSYHIINMLGNFNEIT